MEAGKRYIVHWTTGGNTFGKDSWDEVMAEINKIFPLAKAGTSHNFAGNIKRSLVSDGEIPVAEIFWERQ